MQSLYTYITLMYNVYVFCILILFRCQLLAMLHLIVYIVKSDTHKPVLAGSGFPLVPDVIFASAMWVSENNPLKKKLFIALLT